MFTPDFIFISITLFILSALAFKMNAPKVTIPLLLIYMAFIINKLPDSEINPTISNETLHSRAFRNQCSGHAGTSGSGPCCRSPISFKEGGDVGHIRRHFVTGALN